MEKRKLLKENLEKYLARSKESYIKDNRTKMPEERQDFEKKEMRKAATKAEKQFPYVWNDEKESTVSVKESHLEFGQYFGGVNFDKNGKLIR